MMTWYLKEYHNNTYLVLTDHVDYSLDFLAWLRIQMYEVMLCRHWEATLKETRLAYSETTDWSFEAFKISSAILPQLATDARRHNFHQDTMLPVVFLKSQPIVGKQSSTLDI